VEVLYRVTCPRRARPPPQCFPLAWALRGIAYTAIVDWGACSRGGLFGFTTPTDGCRFSPDPGTSTWALLPRPRAAKGMSGGPLIATSQTSSLPPESSLGQTRGEAIEDPIEGSNRRGGGQRRTHIEGRVFRSGAICWPHGRFQGT
jgi:hypothetical protein